jgi:tetratricopeptide (TPR) repeat protein
MLKEFFLFAALAGILGMAACGPKTLSEEEAYKAADKAYEKAPTPITKIQVLKDFLAQYPGGSHTLDMAENVVYHYMEDLKKPEEAWVFIQTIQGTVQDPGVLRKLQVDSLPVLGKLKAADKIENLAADLSENPMNYDEHMAVSNACVEVGRWDLAQNHALASLKFGTPESFKADNPDRKFPPDRLERYVNMRKAECLTNAAWAQANLGRFAESLKTFEEARAVTVFSFVGASEPPFDLYLGKTLLMQKEYEKAMEVLTPAAVFAGDPDAREGMMSAYEESLKGSVEGFDAYLEGLREKLARTVTDFTLPDYKGTPHTYADLQKGRVVLLSFWFPT